MKEPYRNEWGWLLDALAIIIAATGDTDEAAKVLFCTLYNDGGVTLRCFEAFDGARGKATLEEVKAQFPAHVEPDAFAWEESRFSMQLYKPFERALEPEGYPRKSARQWIKVHLPPIRVAFPAPRPASTVKDETGTIQALADHLKEHSNLTRPAAYKWCLKNKFKGTDNFFRRNIWPNARKQAGLSEHGRVGRRPKSAD
jgi:hypothetical protein